MATTHLFPRARLRRRREKAPRARRAPAKPGLVDRLLGRVHAAERGAFLPLARFSVRLVFWTLAVSLHLAAIWGGLSLVGHLGHPIAAAEAQRLIGLGLPVGPLVAIALVLGVVAMVLLLGSSTGATPNASLSTRFSVRSGLARAERRALSRRVAEALRFDRGKAHGGMCCTFERDFEPRPTPARPTGITALVAGIGLLGLAMTIAIMTLSGGLPAADLEPIAAFGMEMTAAGVLAVGGHALISFGRRVLAIRHFASLRFTMTFVPCPGQPVLIHDRDSGYDTTVAATGTGWDVQIECYRLVSAIDPQGRRRAIARRIDADAAEAFDMARRILREADPSTRPEDERPSRIA